MAKIEKYEVVTDGEWTGEVTAKVIVIEGESKAKVIEALRASGLDGGVITVHYEAEMTGEFEGVIKVDKVEARDLARLEKVEKEKVREEKGVDAHPRKEWQTCYGPAQRNTRKDKHNFSGRRFGRSCCV